MNLKDVVRPLIFLGSKGVGKYTTARWFAEQLTIASQVHTIKPEGKKVRSYHAVDSLID